MGVIFDWSTAIWAALLSWLGYGSHVFIDQLGYLGCNLWWPLSRRRKGGWGLFHSTDAEPNFMTIWIAIIIILYNLDNYIAVDLPSFLYIGLGVGLPVCVFLIWLLRHRSIKAENESEDRVK